MSKEAIAAKMLRQMVPYLEAHNPERYRRFAPKQSAPPTSAELTADDLQEQDLAETNERRRKMRPSGGQL